MSAPIYSLKGGLNAEPVWSGDKTLTSSGFPAQIGMTSPGLVRPGWFRLLRRLDTSKAANGMNAPQSSLLFRALDLFDVILLKSSMPPKPEPEPEPEPEPAPQPQPPPPPRPPPAPPGPFPGDASA